MSKTIYIDAGHGGTDAGAVNGSRYESVDNLKIALAVKSLLVAQGHTVLMARENDIHVSLATRTTQANNAKADIFVSLHRNSFTNSAANGVEIWIYTTAGAVDTGMATEVLERIVKVGVQSNRGIKKGNYHVCRESKMPSMLVELGFISNAKDNELFDKYLNDYALAIAQGICAGLGETWKDTDNKEKPTYRVQVGAFSIKSNAEAFLQVVRDMGLDAFLVVPETAKIE